MQLEMAELAAEKRYKLLSSLIVPRPIAFITTVNEAAS
jgi:flavin reductase (DIM6/NTAB) family NADH-FMN oxidoreductase RutF